MSDQTPPPSGEFTEGSVYRGLLVVLEVRWRHAHFDRHVIGQRYGIQPDADAQ
ncbi:hypothetical protein [Streptomyces sp. NBC_00019]|uniref:hypothetical protein n=1 Tax=Streptomyces sp. NBC_00019 TaxID=2975623 RepID=UPI003249B856